VAQRVEVIVPCNIVSCLLHQVIMLDVSSDLAQPAVTNPAQCCRACKREPRVRRPRLHEPPCQKHLFWYLPPAHAASTCSPSAYHLLSVTDMLLFVPWCNVFAFCLAPNDSESEEGCGPAGGCADYVAAGAGPGFGGFGSGCTPSGRWPP